MIINKDTSFIETYFDNKSGDNLKSTITPTWNDENIEQHLAIIDVPKDAKTIMEVGVGIARLLREIYDINKASHAVGFDASESMVKEGKEYVGDRNINLFKCDGDGTIDIGAGDYFDFCYSFITFQHIPNTETVKKYISEMVRFTRDGGEIMFQVLEREMDRGHLWSYHSIDELINHLKSLGIKTIDLKTLNDWCIVRCKK